MFCMRGQHRLVVAPDFQGLGIGSEMCAHDASECITEARIKGGVTHRFFSKTFHKKLGVSRDGSLLWRAVENSGKEETVGDKTNLIGVSLMGVSGSEKKKKAPIDQRDGCGAVNMSQDSDGRRATAYSHEYIGTDAERLTFF